MSEEHTLCSVDELPEGTHRVVRVGKREIGVFNIRGELHAIPNLCPHQRGPLCKGSVSGALDCGPHTDWKVAWIWEGEVVTCPWHSLEFHVPTGQCLALPDVRLRKFELRLVGGDVRVVL
ncbi:MAG TPA: Rieske 2Fe-2S domain-containing protein [Gaiellaceae bacterium]|nr:Rieske 2Fe-2S domain-containing protein [Gaiellaceae bacterium]